MKTCTFSVLLCVLVQGTTSFAAADLTYPIEAEDSLARLTAEYSRPVSAENVGTSLSPGVLEIELRDYARSYPAFADRLADVYWEAIRDSNPCRPHQVYSTHVKNALAVGAPMRFIEMVAFVVGSPLGTVSAAVKDELVISAISRRPEDPSQKALYDGILTKILVDRVKWTSGSTLLSSAEALMGVRRYEFQPEAPAINPVAGEEAVRDRVRDYQAMLLRGSWQPLMLGKEFLVLLDFLLECDPSFREEYAEILRPWVAGEYCLPVQLQQEWKSRLEDLVPRGHISVHDAGSERERAGDRQVQRSYDSVPSPHQESVGPIPPGEERYPAHKSNLNPVPRQLSEALDRLRLAAEQYNPRDADACEYELYHLVESRPDYVEALTEHACSVVCEEKVPLDYQKRLSRVLALVGPDRVLKLMECVTESSTSTEKDLYLTLFEALRYRPWDAESRASYDKRLQPMLLEFAASGNDYVQLMALEALIAEPVVGWPRWKWQPVDPKGGFGIMRQVMPTWMREIKSGNYEKLAERLYLMDRYIEYDPAYQKVYVSFVKDLLQNPSSPLGEWERSILELRQ